MSKRLLLIYTGGTIGMVQSAQGYVPVSGLQKLIDLKIPPRLSVNMPKYDLLEYPTLIDSANITPLDWRQIASDISNQYQNYDGFVVLHGTDTMAFTASALSFMLQGLTKPVIVTGSQVPLSELRNDAQANLVTAFELASSHDIPEVCLYFNGHLLRGNRSSKMQATGFEAFSSPNYPELAKVGIYIELNQHALLPRPEAAAQANTFQLPDYSGKYVRAIALYPGIEAGIIKALASPPCKALIISAYGVGNGPSLDEHFLRALQEADASGVVLVCLTQCAAGKVNASSYATGAKMAETGIIPGGDMTNEAAFTKLHHLCSLGYDQKEIKALMAESLAGEISL